MREIPSSSVVNMPVRKIAGFVALASSDVLAVEEPLEIRICYGPGGQRIQKNISVTMRTPGNDFDLAIGFLFTEGIIKSYQDVKDVYHVDMACSSQKQNVVQIELSENFVPQLQQADRNFYTTSSCGVCGKSSIASIKTVSPYQQLATPALNLSAEVLYQLSQKLRSAQSGFAETGGIHAAGLFTLNGNLVLLQEDVGRHNALDKLIGSTLAKGLLPLNQYVLLLSGRASFELIQKAAMAGISVVAAIGAPSSLAVELAIEFNITLLGFLKENRFNIYHSDNQLIIPTAYETQN